MRCGALEHAPQGAARADRFGAPGELAEKECGLRLEGDVAPGFGQDAHGGIGVGGVPAGEPGVVVELVVRVPAENHVAEAEILVERREEFIAAQVFAAQDAVGVDDADLDVLDAALGQKIANLDVLLHRSPPRGLVQSSSKLQSFSGTRRVLFRNLWPRYKQDDDRNHQVTGDEVEPGEHRRLEDADVGAEQHDHE